MWDADLHNIGGSNDEGSRGGFNDVLKLGLLGGEGGLHGNGGGLLEGVGVLHSNAGAEGGAEQKTLLESLSGIDFGSGGGHVAAECHQRKQQRQQRHCHQPMDLPGAGGMGDVGCALGNGDRCADNGWVTFESGSTVFSPHDLQTEGAAARGGLPAQNAHLTGFPMGSKSGVGHGGSSGDLLVQNAPLNGFSMGSRSGSSGDLFNGGNAEDGKGRGEGGLMDSLRKMRDKALDGLGNGGGGGGGGSGPKNR